MEHHTVRLIVTIIFLVIAASNMFVGSWLGALIFGGIGLYLGRHFIQHGKLDLHYVKQKKHDGQSAPAASS